MAIFFKSCLMYTFNFDT